MCEILDDYDIVIVEGCIVYVGFDVSYCIGEDIEIIEVEGCYMIPGLCDGYMYIELGMLMFVEFVCVVILYGMIMMFIDLYEIVNVLGFEGVCMMYDEVMM